MKTNKKNQEIINVNNVVANYAQAHTAARSIKKATSTLNQARKALAGIGNEPIVIGRDESKKKVYTTVKSFMETVGIPYGNGQVQLASIKKAWADYLKDKDGNLQVCKEVKQRVKIGKTSYQLYYLDEEGKYKPVTIYQPAPVRDNGWDTYRICDGLAQSKFIDETIAECAESQTAYDYMKATDAFYVHDALTDSYVSVKVK